MITAIAICVGLYMLANAALYLAVHFTVWKANHPVRRS